MDQSELDLIERAKAGSHDAQAALLALHEGMIFKLARSARRRHPAADLDDLAQAGRLGLLLAIDKFEPERGCKLLTMATWWMRQKIDREAAESHPIHLPAHIPNVDLHADAARARRVVFLGQPVNGEGETFLDPADSRSIDALTALGAAEELERLRRSISWLPARLRAIVEGRLGGATLDKLSAELGVCKERVRQLQVEAEDKLAVYVRVASVTEMLLPRRPNSFWAPIELAFLKQEHGRKTLSAIASAIGRQVTSVVSHATALGLYKTNRWTPAQDEFLRAHQDDGWKWCAGQLGMPVAGVYARVKRLGIQHRRSTADQLAQLPALHALGLTCAAIARRLGVSGETVRIHLHRRGLALNPRDELQRLAAARQTFMARYGVETIGELRQLRAGRLVAQPLRSENDASNAAVLDD